MKKRTYRFLATALFSSILLMLVGCTEKTEAETQDGNIQTIEAVLQNTFTGPDDELKYIWNDIEGEEKLKPLRQYTKVRFKDYFTNEETYQEYNGSYGITFLLTADEYDYNLKVKNIEYEKTDSKDDIYDFSIELQYQKEGSELSEVEIVKGQANLNEEHKIEMMLIRNNNDFWNSLKH